MKKFITISFIIALVIAVVTCNSIPPLAQLDEDNLSSLKGIKAEKLVEKWGEMDGTLSGMYGDIWHIDDENMLVVYYDGMEDSRVLDAHIAKIQRDNSRVYVYRDSEEKVIKPSFVLQKNGTFSMTFSAVSSYIGVGKYELTDETLSLYTDDGDFEYHFDVTEEGFAFDGEKSSDMTWFAKIPDGALFY
ncbi:MAG: hypothetical protein IJE55_07025 [Clostridia bacterium]|nr:hypothetical protein [Clostridia bacterium]MBQ6868438.1 hypothetical protein [Clostridia bacterium]MBQ7092905.1 hypothetical protein [Clostridia bacterium]